MTSSSVGVERLEAWFADGRLLRPDPARANTVDLTRAIARCCGAELGELDGPGARGLAERIGEHEHLVFVLVDGLGISLLERLAPDGVLRRHLALELRSVFPSATAAAVTALATGEWPARHGVPGWWLYLEERDLSCVSLPFVERESGAALAQRGLTPADLYPEGPLLERFARPTCVHQPAPISESAYSLYARGSTPGRGYDELSDGVEAVAARVAAAEGPTYDYLYTPSVDKASHDFGPDSAEALEVAQEVERAIGRLVELLAGRARVVVSADHGLLRIAPDDKQVLLPDDPLRALLRCLPTGEPRTPVFHVRAGEAAAFARAFEARFPGQYALLTPDEVERLALLGPGPLGAETRRRLGDFVAVAGEPTVILSGDGDEHGIVSVVGHHGGLRPDEVRIPLILA